MFLKPAVTSLYSLSELVSYSAVSLRACVILPQFLSRHLIGLFPLGFGLIIVVFVKLKVLRSAHRL